MISLQDVTVQMGSATLLADASLDVAPGRLTAVVGPNGAGKTTLLRVTSGTLAPTQGRVTLDGKPMREWTPRALACRRAVLPQQTRLDFSFDVLEVVLMGRTPHVRGGRESERDWRLAERALEAVGLGAFACRDYATLSGGEQQRVHLARALAQLGGVPPDARAAPDATPASRDAASRDADRPSDSDPTPGFSHPQDSARIPDFPQPDASRSESDARPDRYLLLDEPTASLDLAHQHAVMHVARRMAWAGVGVLAILHDLNLAAQYADRLVLLHRGRVHARGAPDAVLTPTRIREVFGLSVRVQPHPCHNCPLVVSAPDAWAPDAATPDGSAPQTPVSDSINANGASLSMSTSSSPSASDS